MTPDPALARIAGQAVQGLFTGAVRASEGVELPGIAGPVWHYADLLVRLGGGEVLSLSPGEVLLLDELPRGASRLHLLDDRGGTCEGRRIVDLFVAADGGLFLLLEGGAYLEHSSLPGGSVHLLGDLREWDAEDLQEEVVSLVSGETRTFQSLLATS